MMIVENQMGKIRGISSDWEIVFGKAKHFQTATDLPIPLPHSNSVKYLPSSAKPTAVCLFYFSNSLCFVALYLDQIWHNILSCSLISSNNHTTKTYNKKLLFHHRNFEDSIYTFKDVFFILVSFQASLYAPRLNLWCNRLRLLHLVDKKIHKILNLK